MSARLKNKICRLNLSYLIAVISISLSSALYPQELDNIKIGLVHSSHTKNLLHAEDNNFYPVQDWELFFLNKKISYEVFDDEGVDDYDFDEVDILILPAIEVLSDDGIENLQDFLEEGKGLFILGRLGVQDDYGNNRLKDLLQSLGGFKVNEFLDRNVIAKNHILYANNFLTHNLQINTSLTVMNNFPLLYIENTSGKIRQFGEYVTEDGSYDDHLLRKSGIAMIENGKGKILWFGFQLSQISVDDEAELPKIIFNGIDWLAAKPIAWLNPWYLNFNSATVITGNLSEPGDYFFELVMPFAYQSMVTNINCFLKPDAIVSFPGEIEKMPSQRELHILFDETDYLDIPEDDRLKMIENAAGILRNKTNQSLLGIKYLNRSKQSNITDNVLFKHIDFISYEDNSIISFSAGKGSLSGQQEILYPSITSSFNNGVYEMSELADYKKHFDSIHKRLVTLAASFVNEGNKTAAASTPAGQSLMYAIGP